MARIAVCIGFHCHCDTKLLFTGTVVIEHDGGFLSIPVNQRIKRKRQGDCEILLLCKLVVATDSIGNTVFRRSDHESALKKKRNIIYIWFGW